jgi:arylsulfatase A-like enzyme
MFSLPWRALASALVCLALVTCSKQQHATPVAREPLCRDCNVILISMDTVRADHMSAYGYERKTTPNVDALAAHSVLFENAVSQASWTLPAHGSMMTGLYPGRLGVIHYPAKRKLPDDVDTLASSLLRAGYTTAGFTGGGFVSSHFGFDHGFETYATDGRRFEHNIDEALAWLDQNKDRRFFLFFHGYDAHRPYYSHPMDKEAVGLRGKGQVEKRNFCTRSRRDRPSALELATILGFYDASIHMGDRIVGRLLDAVHKQDLMKNTVILITADHGEEFFDHGNCDHVRFLYREIVHVPWILYVPGFTPGGERISDVVPASLAVTRTLLDVVGVEHDMPGVSLVPMLRGQRGLFGVVFSEADSIAGSMGSRGATIAMTGDRYKLISYLEEGDDEAYNVVEDPTEHTILPESHDAYGGRQTLRAWHASMESLPGDVAVARAPARESGTRGTDGARAGIDTANERRAKSAPAKGEEEQLELPKKLQDELRSLGYLDE